MIVIFVNLKHFTFFVVLGVTRCYIRTYAVQKTYAPTDADICVNPASVRTVQIMHISLYMCVHYFKVLT